MFEKCKSSNPKASVLAGGSADLAPAPGDVICVLIFWKGNQGDLSVVALSLCRTLGCPPA